MADKPSRSAPTLPPSAPRALPPFFAGLGAGLAFMIVGTACYFLVNPRHEETPPPVVQIPDEPPPPEPPPPIGAWWDGVPDSTLAGTVALLTQMLPQDKALLDSLGSKNEAVRLDAFQKLLAKLPELTRNTNAKPFLERVLIDWYVWEPADKNVLPLKNWFVHQIPKINAEYPPGYRGEDVERSFWALYLSMEILTQKSMRPDRARDLAHELDQALGLTIDPGASRAELMMRAEKLLALRCYRNLLPTTAKSVEHGLALRGVLVQSIGDRLPRSARDKIDFHLAAQAFPAAKNCWPGYRSLLQDCLKHNDPATDHGIVALYASADAELAAMMEPVLAARWDDLLKDGLKHEAKVNVLRRKLGIPIPVDRATQFDKAAKGALAGAKSPPDKTTAVLQETARLSHAATLACALSKKDAGNARFDELIAETPEIEIAPAAMPPAKDDNAKKPDGPKAPAGDPLGKGGPRVIKDQLTPGAFSKVHVVSLKRGRSYAIHLVSNFDNFLRLQNSRGVQLAQDDDSGGGLNALIVFTPAYDDAFKIIATSATGRLIGPYTLTIEETKGFGAPLAGLPPGLPFGGPLFPPPRGIVFFGRFPPPRPFPGHGPMFMPGPPGVVNPGQPKDQKPEQPQTPAATPLVDEADLKALGTNLAKARSTAFHAIVAKLKGDLTEKDFTNAQAVRIAKYLVTIQDLNEADDAAAKLAPLAKSRNLMLALADAVELSDARKDASEIIVGKLLQQPLDFSKEAWRPACRKLLLLQALEQTGKSYGAEQAADFLCQLYQEQAVLLGMDAKTVEPMTRPAPVMAALIQHVAASLGKQNLAKEQKDFLDQLPRQLRAAEFAARNDLEHTVMLQRIWFQVLAIQLEQQNPQRAPQIRQVQADLSAADRAATNVLEQLRGGEEKLLRLWQLTLETK